MSPNDVAIIGGVVTLILNIIQIIKAIGDTQNRFLKVTISLLVCIGVVVILLSHYFFYSSTIHQPKISITSIFEKDCWTKVNRDSAGYRICVEGSVLDADHKFLCLVVDDQNNKWVEPKSEEIITTTFAKTCYLGAGADDTAAVGRAYYVFAAVTKRKYSDKYETLDPQSVITSTTPIKLLRRRLGEN